MKARHSGVCPRCGFDFPAGTEIGKLPRPHWGWGHISCPASQDDAQEAADTTLNNKAPEDTAVSQVRDGQFSVACAFDYDVLDSIKALPQRRFSKDSGMARWWVPAELFGDLVRGLQDSNTDATNRLANDLIKGKRFAPARRIRDKATGRLENSRAAEIEPDSVDIPAPEGLEYRPFQLAFIAWALGVKNILLGDEMGLGKTIQALGLINAKPAIRRVLVVCPASLRYNWAREATKWLVGDYTISVMEGRKGKGWPTKTTGNHIVIINYDLAKANAKLIHSFEWDLVVVDEAHLLKNAKAQRTKAILGYWDKTTKQAVPGVRAKRNLYMTGTPIPNRVSELWNLLKKLDADGLGRNWKLYMTRYAEATQETVRTGGGGYQQVWVTDGAAHLDELQRRMRSKFLMRRLKQDVAKELPPKVRQIIAIPPDGATTLLRREAKLQAAIEAEQLEREIAAAIAQATDCSYADLLGDLAGHSPAFEESALVRHEIALKKVPVVVKHVQALVSSVGKVVLFAWHRDVIDAIEAGLRQGSKDYDPISTVKLVGGMGAKAADSAVDQFQTTDVQVFLGNISAAGVGHTLTKSSHVVFAELPWRPCDASQAEDRCHRMGQEGDVVTVQHVLFDGSMDIYMANMLLEKQAVADGALDDLGADEPDFETVDINSPDYQVKFHQSVFEAGRKREAQAAKAEARSVAQAAKRERVARVARILTDDQVGAVHECLRQLAVVCDGAREKDGMGFNAVDTGVGRLLAARGTLTREEAALGREIIPTYSRQIGHLDAFTVALRKPETSEKE
jgi:SWI/SNF-related matrix-associated actin-dependent regulator 1 of chromatin subfamily A